MSPLRIVVMSCVLAVSLFPAAEASSMQDSTMTAEQAIAWVRASKYVSKGSEFRVLHEIQANAETQEVAKRSTQAAKANHISVSYDGIFLHLLQEGGYWILEYDPARQEGIALYLVTRTAGGAPQVFPLATEERVSLGALIGAEKQSEAFLRDFFNTKPPEMGVLVDRYFEGKVFAYNPPTLQNYVGQIDFSVPVKLANTFGWERAKSAGVLSWGLYNWVVGETVSMPDFSANPEAAKDGARRRILREMETFVVSEGHPADYARTVDDLEGIRSKGQLSKRMDELARLNARLEQVFGPRIDPIVFKWNVELSLFPMSFHARPKTEAGETLLEITYLPDIETTCRIDENGNVKLERVGIVPP